MRHEGIVQDIFSHTSDNTVPNNDQKSKQDQSLKTCLNFLISNAQLKLTGEKNEASLLPNGAATPQLN